MSLENVSEDDLKAYKAGDLSKVSTEGLMAIRSAFAPTSERDNNLKIMGFNVGDSSDIKTNVEKNGHKYTVLGHEVDPLQSLAGVGAGLTNQVPGSYTLGGVVNALEQPVYNLITGSDVSMGDSYRQGYDNTKRKVESYADKTPISYNFGKGFASIPEYVLGGRFLGGLIPETGVAANIIKSSPAAVEAVKGALLNVGVGQGARTEIDPSASFVDALTGAVLSGLPYKVGSVAGNSAQPFAKMANESINKMNPLGIGIGSAREAIQNEAKDLAKSEYNTGIADLQDKFRTQKEMASNNYQSSLDSLKNDLMDLPLKGRAESGEALGKSIKDLGIAATTNYEMSVKPIINKYGLSTHDPEALKSAITDQIRDIGASSERMSPEYKKLAGKLSEFADKLNIGPKTKEVALGYEQAPSKSLSVMDLYKIDKDLKSLADFGSGNRGPAEKIYGSLSKISSEELEAALAKKAPKQEFEKFVSATKDYRDAKSILDNVGQFKDLHGEHIIARAKGSLPESFLSDVLNKTPGVANSTGDVILHDLASKAKTPEMLNKAINGYGRDNLKSILGDRFDKLLRIESDFGGLQDQSKSMVAPKPIPFKYVSPAEKRIASMIEGYSKSNKPLMIKYLAPALASYLNGRRSNE